MRAERTVIFDNGARYDISADQQFIVSSTHVGDAGYVTSSHNLATGRRVQLACNSSIYEISRDSRQILCTLLSGALTIQSLDGTTPLRQVLAPAAQHWLTNDDQSQILATRTTGPWQVALWHIAAGASPRQLTGNASIGWFVGATADRSTVIYQQGFGEDTVFTAICLRINGTTVTSTPLTLPLDQGVRGNFGFVDTPYGTRTETSPRLADGRMVVAIHYPTNSTGAARGAFYAFQPGCGSSQFERLTPFFETYRYGANPVSFSSDGIYLVYGGYGGGAPIRRVRFGFPDTAETVLETNYGYSQPQLTRCDGRDYLLGVGLIRQNESGLFAVDIGRPIMTPILLSDLSEPYRARAYIVAPDGCTLYVYTASGIVQLSLLATTGTARIVFPLLSETSVVTYGTEGGRGTQIETVAVSGATSERLIYTNSANWPDLARDSVFPNERLAFEVIGQSLLFREGSTLYSVDLMRNDTSFQHTAVVISPVTRWSKIVVVRNAASVGSAEVGYTVVGGDAVAGVDYTLPGDTLTLPPGEREAAIPITLLHNPAATAPRTLVLELRAPAGVTLGARRTITITLRTENNRQLLPVVRSP